MIYSKAIYVAELRNTLKCLIQNNRFPNNSTATSDPIYFSGTAKYMTCFPINK
jgi:hypothetical protein